MYAGEIHQAGRFADESRVRFYRAAGYVPLYDDGGFAVEYTGISVDGVLFTVYLVGAPKPSYLREGDIDG